MAMPDTLTYDLSVSALQRKWLEATRMRQEQQSAWEDFSQTISPQLIHTWSTIDTTPKLINGKWTSVFVLSEAHGQSCTLVKWC